MMNVKMKASKKGVTLVESVFAVVILGILTIGILSLLSAGSVKIGQISGESKAHAAAVQKMDMVISAISNGSDNYINVDDATGAASIDISALKNALGFTVEETATGYEIIIDGIEADTVSSGETSYTRGWYMTLTYKGATVQGYASNTEGVFDRNANEEE